MTEETEPSGGETQVAEREIDFMGRKIWVTTPSPEQLLVWQRTLAKLEKADVEGWNGHQVMSALERLRSLLDSVILHETDVDWLDGEMLAKRVGLKEAATIVPLTVEAFSDGNRAERRGAAKAAKPKKAARKRA